MKVLIYSLASLCEHETSREKPVLPLTHVNGRSLAQLTYATEEMKKTRAKEKFSILTWHLDFGSM